MHDHCRLDVAVLAGGQGTRLRPAIGDALPKVLAPVRGRPYLDILLERLEAVGVRRAVLCLGHLADSIASHLAGRPAGGMEVVLSVEPEPLGTAGALALARPLLASDPVLVVNGDTWVELDLDAFVAFHRDRAAFTSLLCVAVADTARYGSVDVDADGRVTRFAEKQSGPAGPGLVNAGYTLLSARALDQLAVSGARSLETEFLQVQPPGTLSAFVRADARFVDIGTPDSLIQAATIIARASPAP